MLEKLINSVSEWFLKHLSPKYLLMVIFLTSCILFAPDQYLQFFGLAAIPNPYRAVTSLFFLGSSFLVVSWVVSYFGKPIIQAYQENRRLKKCFEHLGMDEILCLQGFCETGNTSVRLDPNEGAVQRLIQQKIIFVSGRILGMDDCCAHSLTKYAAPFLERYRFQKLLDKITKRQLEARQESIDDRSTQKP